MAWRKCMECGHKVMVAGDRCPYCGESLPPDKQHADAYGPQWFANWRSLGLAEKTGYLVSGAFVAAIILAVGATVLYIVFSMFRFLFGLFA